MNPNEMVRQAVMKRLCLPNMNCAHCDLVVELWEMDEGMDKDFKELVHRGGCAISRRAYHDKKGRRGC